MPQVERRHQWHPPLASLPHQTRSRWRETYHWVHCVHVLQHHPKHSLTLNHRNILIHIAVLGYACAPGFEFNLPDAPMPAQQIALALLAPTSRLRLVCEREDVDADEVAACVLNLLEELNFGPRMVEREKIGQDWRRLMENSARDAMSKGIVPSTSGTHEPNQQHGDLKDMNTVQKRYIGEVERMQIRIRTLKVT
jgi:coenzyme A diphosphatase NUDT7